jgi:hypothetical protein
VQVKCKTHITPSLIGMGMIHTKPGWAGPPVYRFNSIEFLIKR